jgi:hypothetical protein
MDGIHRLCLLAYPWCTAPDSIRTRVASTGMVPSFPSRQREVLGSLDRSPDRVNTLRTKVRTLEHELYNRNCTIASTKCSNPYNVGWEGVFIPPTLLHLSRNAPAIPTKVKRLQQGYFVISLGWTVRLGYSYPDHVFFCPLGTFGSGP